MTETGLLIGMAQIAIAIAGFTSVVAFLSGRGEGQWREIGLLLLDTLLKTSMCVLVLFLSPIILYLSGLPEESVWRCICGIGILFNVEGTFYSTRRTKKLSADERTQLPMFNQVVLFTLSSAVIALLVGGLLGIAYKGEPMPVITSIAHSCVFQATCLYSC